MAEDFASVTFDDKEVRTLLETIVKRTDQITDLDRRVVGILSAVVYQDVIDHFETESDPNGKWTPWSESYRAFMQKIGKANNKILQDTGRLRQSFTPASVKKTGEGLLWFNNAKTNDGFPYAAAHNDGGGKLPQRQFMWLSDRALGKMSNQLLEFILSERITGE